MDQNSAGNVYKAPEVILVVGNSLRRFHTAIYLRDILTFCKHHVDTFTTTLDFDDEQTKVKYAPYFTKHDYKSFKLAYEEVEGARSHKAYIIIEVSLDVLPAFPISKHNVKTILFTDMRMGKKEQPAEVKEYIDHEYHHSHILDRLIYNTNTVPKAEFADQYFFVQVDEISIPRQYSFGASSMSTCGFDIDEVITVTHEGKKSSCARPAIIDGVIKSESLMGAISYALEEDLALGDIEGSFQHLTALPLFDEVKAEGTMLWTRPMILGDAIWDALQSEQALCIGVSIYLYNEDLIERSIDKVSQIVVVAEQEAESELYTEYFLKKERQSDHKIIYTSSRGFLPHIPSTLFNSEKIMYIFEYLDTFKNIITAS